MVKLRQEFDMNILKKSIEKKANIKDLELSTQGSETKIKLLDNNVVLLANDMETF